MIKITKEIDIIKLLEEGYYIVLLTSETDDCAEYWHVEDAIYSKPSGKSFYCYTFINDFEYPGWDKWYKDFQLWKEEDSKNWLKLEGQVKPFFACTLDELQKF